MSVFVRGAPAQKIDYEPVGVHGEGVVEYPYRRQHRQLAVCSIKLVSSNQRAYALGLEHAADQMRFGWMFRRVYQLHGLSLSKPFCIEWPICQCPDAKCA